MARTSIYLNFERNTEDVFNYYRSIFGGEFVGGIQRMGDVPVSEGQPPLADSDRQLILHIELAITGGQVIMGTDAPESMGFKIHRGNNIHINLEPDSKAEADRLFKALSAEGKISMPLQEMFWGAYFGSCTDKYGTQWMINCDEARAKRHMPVTNPELDLIFERASNLTVEQLWKGWTDPETLMKWFCPRPWKVTSCRTDLRAGGEFHTIMEGPNGERNAGDGCYLEVIPYKKLVWTNMMSKGYRPNPADVLGFPFVVTVEFESEPQGSIYRATVQHRNSEGRSTHEKMGFQEGWGIAFNQLVEHYKSIK